MPTRARLMVAALALTGCSYVSVVEHDQGGGVWYVRNSTFLGLTTGSDVWHCFPPDGGVQAACFETREAYAAGGAEQPKATREPSATTPRGTSATPCKIDGYCPTGFCEGSNSCTPP